MRELCHVGVVLSAFKVFFRFFWVLFTIKIDNFDIKMGVFTIITDDFDIKSDFLL
jgi:hypothetical protein